MEEEKYNGKWDVSCSILLSPHTSSISQLYLEVLLGLE